MYASLYIKYGGYAAIHHLIENFYEKLLASKLVGSYFEHANMAELIDHQCSFICFILGGPVSFTDEHLKAVHSHLDIKEEAWFEVMTLLAQALLEFGMDTADADMIINKLVAKKGMFLCTPV